MADTINSGVAALRTLESWGVDHIYGIPGGTVNNLMYALDAEKDRIKYVHVRHEEVGALAAVADTKLTGTIGVAFGSAGPGATHLYQGAYDAMADKVPTLFIVGQNPQALMNQDFFQEFDENPWFKDAGVYARPVLGPGSDDQIKQALDLISKAKKPVLYVGQGTLGAADEVMAFAKKFQMPVITTALGKQIIPYDFESLLGSAARVASKPANEALQETDLMLFVGSNYPFAEAMFKPDVKFIQIDSNPQVLGKRHQTDVAILADAKKALQRFIELGQDAAPSDWYAANVDNVTNWHQYNDHMMNRTTGDLRFEPAFKEINRISDDDAIYSVDVGDVTQNAVRLLKVNGKQPWITSGLFATMGVGLPGAIAASLSYPGRQVFNLAGDGAAAMVMQDLSTEVGYHLPVINVIFSNDALGFIEDEQEDDNYEWFGISLPQTDFAKAAEAQGMTGITVTKVDEMKAAFDQALELTKAGKPALIDVKITNERPIPVEKLTLDPDKFDQKTIDDFKKRYYADDLIPLSQFLKQHHVQ